MGQKVSHCHYSEHIKAGDGTWEKKTSQSTAEIPNQVLFHIQLVCPHTRMARLELFLFSLGLAASQPAQESRVIGSGAIKPENSNPLESRIAPVVVDGNSDSGAPEGPASDVGKLGNLDSTIYYLLCNKYTSGNLKERANKIASYLGSKVDSNSQWIVFLSKDTEGFSAMRKNVNRYYLQNVCGHHIWVFQREDWRYERTSCSSSEMDRAENIIRGAASSGGTYTAVKNRIRYELAAFGVKQLFTMVGGYNSNWNYGTHVTHISCGRWVAIKTSATGDDYLVWFFLQ